MKGVVSVANLINTNDLLKGGELLSIATGSKVKGDSVISRHFSNWVLEGKNLSAGSAGNGGYDLNCGRYLKIPLQTPIDNVTIEALKNKQTTYWDFPHELPVRIAEKLKIENLIDANPMTEIVTTCGITPAIDTVLAAFINSGDEIICMDPDFVTSYGQVLGRNAKLVIASAFKENKGDLEATRWEFNPQAVENMITHKTKMILYSNPNNPIGYVYSKDDLQAIADIAIKYDLIVLENECYERLVYSDEFAETLIFNTILGIPEMKERAIIIQGVSKNYHLSGYRVGWIVSNSEIIDMIKFVQIWSTFTIAPTITQYGVVAALTMPLREDYVRESHKIYKANIDYLWNALGEFPEIECAKPAGGPFCFVDISGTGYNDIDLAKLLYEKGVNTVYGSPWGKIASVNHLRLALSNDPEYHKTCVDALVIALKEILVK